MGILDELFRRKPEDEFLPEYARPADPLRQLRDAIPENKDGGISMLNMIRSALGTSANWLDGTKDPSLIGPAEVMSPLGLAGMGMGVANAVTRPGRDFRIADDLARQHPEASAVGEIPKFAPMRDASNPTSAAHVYDYGLMPGTPRAPVNTNATPYAVMADNAKGSAPGTVVNSIAEKPYDVRRAEFEQHIKSGKFASEDDVPVPFQYTRLPPNHEDVVRMDQWSTLPHKKEAVDLSKLWATQKSVDGEAVSDMVRGGVKGEPPPPSAYRALDGTIYLVDGHKRMSAAAARGEPTAEAMVVGADNAKGSAPGVVVNSMADGGGIAGRLKAAMGNEEAFTAELQGLQGMSVPELKKLASDFTGAPAHTIRNKQDALDAITRRHRNIMDTTAKAQFTKGFTIEASPYASAPGLAANSTQQPRDARELSEPMLLELLRKLEEGA